MLKHAPDAGFEEAPEIVARDSDGWMEGWIYAADNPYYAVTSADGKFSITDVPPGSYTLVTFQPFIGPIEQSVTVGAGKPTPLTIELKKP